LDDRLVVVNERAARNDARLGQVDARVGRVSDRVVQVESRWAQVDEQARQRGVETDVSPLGLRVGRLEDRVRKLEPIVVTLDGIEIQAQTDEKRLYDEAVGLIGKGEFERAASALAGFQRSHPASQYTPWARFWQGSAAAELRDYRTAVSVMRALVNETPNHPRAAEAMLVLSRSQVELKDRAAARKTLEDLLRLYPDSDAAKVARQRLIALR
jgi:tol-pal system protein YbgF